MSFIQCKLTKLKGIKCAMMFLCSVKSAIMVLVNWHINSSVTIEILCRFM